MTISNISNWLVPEKPTCHVEPERTNMFDETKEESLNKVKKAPSRKRSVVKSEHAKIVYLLRKGWQPKKIYKVLASQGCFVNSDGLLMTLEVVAPVITRLRLKNKIPPYRKKYQIISEMLAAGIHLDDIKASLNFESKELSSHVRHAGGSVSKLRKKYARFEKMNLSEALKQVVEPGLKMLPESFNNVNAEVFLLAAGQHLSMFQKHKVAGSVGYFKLTKGKINSTRDSFACKNIIETLHNQRVLDNDVTKLYKDINSNPFLDSLMSALYVHSSNSPFPHISQGCRPAWRLYSKLWGRRGLSSLAWQYCWEEAARVVRSKSINNLTVRALEFPYQETTNHE